MKYFSLVAFSLFITFTAAAQFQKVTYLLDKNGNEVNTMDSADFVRVINEPDSGSKLYNLYAHYKSGAKKAIGKVSGYQYGLIYDGLLSEFYENGAKKSVLNHEKGAIIGDAYYYHQNGKLAKHTLHVPSNDETAEVKGFFEKAKLLFKQDSLGKVTVKDGNRHDIAKTEFEKDTLIEEGDYKDGFKEGIWNGKYVSGKSNFIEKYNLGSLIEGVNKVGDSTILYKEVFAAPRYDGGVERFYKFIQRKLNYPSDAIRKNVSGQVIVTFVIEKDGIIKEAKIGKPLFPSIDKEAIRIILASPKWIPGMERGRPVRVKYNIPIKFG